MNFLWLAHAIPYPPKAGFLLRSYNLLRELARHHTVDVVAFIQEQWITTLFPSYEEGLRESESALKEFCRDVSFLPIDKLKRPWGKQITAVEALLSGSTYTTTWLDSASARKNIARQLASTAYDLVHFDTIGLAAYRPLVKSIPATLTHHNIESHMMLRRADNSSNLLARAYFRREGRILQNIEATMANQFSMHITCSELDSKRLREIIPNVHATPIPNGVDCDYFTSSDAPTRPNSIIFVGTMNWYPNIDAMLFFLKEVYPGLKKLIPALTMDIAGSNPPESVIELAKSLSGVTVHGYVDDVRPMIDSAAVFVCPIRDGGGTKLKILDAFAMKKCVVAHPIACEGIDVTSEHDVLLAERPQELINLIAAALADDAQRKRIGEAARKLVEDRYSYRAIGAEFSSLLERTARAEASPLRA